MTLRLVGGGGKRGRPIGSTGPFKEHELSNALWNAIYPTGERSMAVIAARMSTSTGVEVSEEMARNAIVHVRKHAYSYGWTIPVVQKGRGKDRKYLPALVDPNDPTYRITAIDSDGHNVAVQKGAISSARNISTELRRSADGLDIFANSPNLSLAEQRGFRKAGALLDATIEVLKDALRKMGS